MLERLIQGSSYLTVITVLLCLMAALALCVAAAMSFATIVADSIQQGPWLPKVAKEAAIGFLNMIDLLLIAIGLQVIAVGIYRIFLNSDLAVPSGLRVSSFDELKSTVAPWSRWWASS